MFDQEARDARRDAMARLARNGSRIDITNRYLGVASYGGVRHPSPPDLPVPRPEAVAREVAADADRILGTATGPPGPDTTPALAGPAPPDAPPASAGPRILTRRAGRRWPWRLFAPSGPVPASMVPPDRAGGPGHPGARPAG